MRVVVRAAVAVTALVAVFSAGLPASASAASKPGSVKSVVASPGAAVGQIKVAWKASGSHTGKFRIETALTPFGSSDDGRNAQAFTVSGSKRSTTLSATSVAKAGAAPATGNHLYIRVVAVSKSGSHEGKSSDLVATTARGLAPAAVGSPLRIASYNIRSAVYDGQGGRSWAKRAPDVAADIVKTNPGIVAIQEASPARFGGLRQTESLQAALLAADPGKRYTITRTTGYNPPGTAHGSQAARIVYDATRYTLTNPNLCADTTTGADGISLDYSTSCSFDLPILPGDARTWMRSAAYAEFTDLATGKPFLVVSAHLDYRHSKNKKTEASLNNLRTLQAATIWANMNLIRKVGEPVVVAGDFNASQADAAGNGPHDYLVAQGFYDAAGALRQAGLEFPSLNHFDKVLDEDPQGYARRVDQILVYGAPGSSRFVELVKAKDKARHSDHNMIYADVVLPPS